MYICTYVDTIIVMTHHKNVIYGLKPMTTIVYIKTSTNSLPFYIPVNILLYSQMLPPRKNLHEC